MGTVNCDSREGCFFKDADEKVQHVCNHCIRNKDLEIDEENKKEDYYNIIQRNGY